MYINIPPIVQRCSRREGQCLGRSPRFVAWGGVHVVVKACLIPTPLGPFRGRDMNMPILLSSVIGFIKRGGLY